MEPTPEKDVCWKIKRLHSAYAQFRERDIQILDLTSTQAYLLGYLSRRNRIVLTERALAVHEQILERIQAKNALATAYLTEDEVATLHCLLDQVYANLTAASTENGKGPCLCMDESFEKNGNL